MSTPNYSLIQQHHFKSVDNAPGAAERTADRMASNVPTDPNTSSRRLSFTQRLVGSGREWMNGFYGSVEKDDLSAGHGFADGIDDFIPGVLASGQRRRNSSISSEASDDMGSGRRGSITDRVAGLQLNRKPKSPLESYAVGFATVIDDQN